MPQAGACPARLSEGSGWEVLGLGFQINAQRGFLGAGFGSGDPCLTASLCCWKKFLVAGRPRVGFCSAIGAVLLEALGKAEQHDTQRRGPVQPPSSIRGQPCSSSSPSVAQEAPRLLPTGCTVLQKSGEKTSRGRTPGRQHHETLPWSWKGLW